MRTREGGGGGLVQFLQGKFKISPEGIAHLTLTLFIILSWGRGGPFSGFQFETGRLTRVFRRDRCKHQIPISRGGR